MVDSLRNLLKIKIKAKTLNWKTSKKTPLTFKVILAVGLQVQVIIFKLNLNMVHSFLSEWFMNKHEDM